MIMTRDELVLDLALRAIHDPDARVVLEDLCSEGGPEWSVVDEDEPPPKQYGRHGLMFRAGSREVTVDGAAYRWPCWRGEAGPGDPVMRALAAALLFRGWARREPGGHVYPWVVVRRVVGIFDPLNVADTNTLSPAGRP